MEKIICPSCKKGELYLEEKVFAYMSSSAGIKNGKIIIQEYDLDIQYSDTHSLEFICNNCYKDFNTDEIVEEIGCDFE